MTERPHIHRSRGLVGGLVDAATRAGRGTAVLLIRAYQACIRPHLIGQCKYCPTCSEYGIQAISQHGLWRGGWLTFRRLLRCHPFARGGIDPVPPRRSRV